MFCIYMASLQGLLRVIKNVFPRKFPLLAISKRYFSSKYIKFYTMNGEKYKKKDGGAKLAIFSLPLNTYK